MTDDRAGGSDLDDRTAEIDRLDSKLDRLGDDSDRLRDSIDGLETKIDRLALLLAALVLLQLVHVVGDVAVYLFGGALVLGFLGLVVVFFVALNEGL